MPEELKHAEQLMYNAKYTDALAIIEDFEKTKNLTEIYYLSSLILKGNILIRMLKIEKALEVGEQAYRLSQKLENNIGIFNSLVLKSFIQFLGQLDESYELIIQAEQVARTLTQESQEELWKREELLSYVKSWIYFSKGDFDNSIKIAEQSLGFAERTGRILDVANKHIILGIAYAAAGDFDKAIKWNTEIWETLNRADKTGEVLEIDKPHSLGDVVNEIFNIDLQSK